MAHAATSRLGLFGRLFFLILAPTSSIVPVLDAAFEHRMYLPSAAVIVAAVIGCYGLLPPFAHHATGRLRGVVGAGGVSGRSPSSHWRVKRS